MLTRETSTGLIPTLILLLYRGKSAIWINSDLIQGSSHPTSTFGNTCLGSTTDFQCQAIELWGLVDE